MIKMLKMLVSLAQRPAQRKNFVNIDHKKAIISLGKYSRNHFFNRYTGPLQAAP
jgi:hypothetical protein